jgi:hypothetical protein
MFADSYFTLNRWKNYFCQLLNVHGVNYVMRTEMYKTEPSVLVSSYFEVEIPIEDIRRYEPPGTDQIPAEMIQAGCNTLYYEIHRCINFVGNKEEQSQ